MKIGKEKLESNLETYTARVLSVYDGDTIRADIDLGLSFKALNQRIRLARINTPEIKGRRRAAGIGARDFVRRRIAGLDVILQITDTGRGRYGRYIAEVWYPTDDAVYTNLNDELLDRGFADPL